jgi:tetratricopeptide (TPR) repeat protein
MDRSTGERNEPRELLSRFRRWLDDPEAPPGIIHDLASLNHELLGEFARLFSGGELRSAIATLITRARDSSVGAPREAIALTRLATALGACYFTDDPQQDASVEGDAWKAHAASLLRAGDYRDSDSACHHAASFYSLVADEGSSYERTLLDIIQAQVAHFLGDSERGLQLAKDAATTLARAFPTKKKDYIRARTIFGTILVAVQRYDEGLKALDDCAEAARQDGDTETLASLVNNIGYVYMQLGNRKAARECFTTALQGFTSLGLKTEMVRANGGLARLAMQEGRYNEAISELYMARAAYLELRMPVVAAEVNARIIEALFAAGRMRDIPTLCAQAVETFTKANLPREAAKALAYMNAAAQQGTLTTDEVEDLREFFQRLQTEPDELFELTDEEGGG